jgi:two-component system chemotaxis response regulator CheB
MTHAPLRLVLVEDSQVYRKAMRSYLGLFPNLEVVAEASNGEAGVEATLDLKPDLVLMDVRMPVLDGLEATARIMSECATPILLMTAAENLGMEVDLGLRALELGALELISKPERELLTESSPDLARQIERLAQVPVISHIRRGSSARVRRSRVAGPNTEIFKRASRLLILVASTGGPTALRRILEALPADLPAAVVLLQHIDGAFEEGLARWLDDCSPLQVRVGHDDDALLEGSVLLAPQGREARVTLRRRLSLTPPQETRKHPHCPSGDLLLTSAGSAYGSKAVGVVLTGMGRDGAAGLLSLRESGGATIAQDEQSSVIYGMPRAAAEAGAVQHVVALGNIAQRVTDLLL